MEPVIPVVGASRCGAIGRSYRDSSSSFSDFPHAVETTTLSFIDTDDSEDGADKTRYLEVHVFHECERCDDVVHGREYSANRDAPLEAPGEIDEGDCKCDQQGGLAWRLSSPRGVGSRLRCETS